MEVVVAVFDGAQEVNRYFAPLSDDCLAQTLEDIDEFLQNIVEGEE